ncbi:MAG: hypothetical protein NTZ92_07960 [Candidatus Omnitrophica bacterium]|nr:hypothetical protein [Candidatus Omnitrophota bacterium]
MRRNIFLACVVIICSSCVVLKAYSWGSTKIAGANFETHQFIATKAYDLLEKDPAFEKEKFPALNEILEFEGTTRGPDAEGLTDYSCHYYNPNLAASGFKGKGPVSEGENYGKLVQALNEGRKNDAAKHAAWSEHFMADMHVPYHSTGCSRDSINAIFKAKGKEAIFLEQAITGSASADKIDFRNAIQNFQKLANAPANKHLDWFDPWYWDGSLLQGYQTSTHVLYEGKLSHPKEYGLSGFDTNWKNPVLNPRDNFQLIYGQLLLTAQKAAETAAMDTAKNFESYKSDAAPAIKKSIQSVYTVWRASISALKPEISYKFNGEDYTVSLSVRNVASESAKNVSARLSIEGGGFAGDALRTIGDIPAGGSAAKCATWNVGAFSGKCTVTIEVFGTFNTTPDSQCSVVEKDLNKEEGFVFYEGSVDDLMAEAEKHITGRKAEGEEFKISQSLHDLKPEINRAEKHFECKKNIQQYADGSWYNSSVYSVTVKIEAPKSVYPGSLDYFQKNSGFSDAQIKEIEKRMLEFGTFYSNVAGYAESFGKGKTDEGAAALENNIPQDLWQESINKNYFDKPGIPTQDKELKIWKAEADIPRKVDGSYHIIYVKRDMNDNWAYYLRVAAANVYIYITVYDSRSLLKSYPKLSYSAPDAKAILYQILKKLQFNGNDFFVAEPRNETAPKPAAQTQIPGQQPATAQSVPEQKTAQVDTSAAQKPSGEESVDQSVKELKEEINKAADELGKSLKDIFN